MKILKFLFLLLVIVTYSQNLFGQSNFMPGFIITNEGDTLKGLLDYRGDLKNSNICSFKKDIDDKAVDYQPGQIQAYRISDYKYYITKEVNSENEVKPLFVEYLVNGIADLYYFRDNAGDHYLIENQDGRILELTEAQKTVYIKGKQYVANPNKHVGLLKATFNDCLEIQPELEKASLNHKSLSKIVEDYHGYVCDGEKCIVYQKELPAVKICFGPELGLNVTSINFHENRFYSIFPFKNSIYPSVGLNTSIILPRINEKLSFDVNLEAGKLNYQTTDFKLVLYEGSYQQMTEYIDINFNAVYFKAIGSIKYTYPKGKFQPFTSLGVGLQKFVKAESHRNYLLQIREDEEQYTKIDSPIRPNFYVLSGKLGGIYRWSKKGIPYANLKFEIALEEVTGKKDTNGSSKLTKLQTTAIAIGYYF